MQPLEKERFYSLDFLRGLAAISIVFWHWNHFFFHSSVVPASAASLPFFSVFRLFYEKGRLAVDLFYSLSGFIFFWLYSEKVSTGKINSRSFFILRFSRLYPLHFACIWLTLILQWTYKNTNGSFFVYAFNDAYHTVLNLLFVQSWGLEKGYSLDGPTWSVSIEVLVYVLFFLLASRHILRNAWVAVLIALMVLYLKWIPVPIQMGVFCFFTGGAIYHLYSQVRIKSGLPASVLIWTVTIISWIIALKGIDTLYLENLALSHPSLARFIHFPIYLFPQAILFPLTILSLALSESYLKRLWSNVGSIGDITYSTYLLHFPLQLVFVLSISSVGLDQRFFTTPISLSAYFACLITISILSYRKFEVPAQKWLRSKLSKTI